MLKARTVPFPYVPRAQNTHSCVEAHRNLSLTSLVEANLEVPFLSSCLASP